MIIYEIVGYMIWYNRGP